MISIDEPICYELIDSNICSLVRYLNNLPGILTANSCGGHKNASKLQYKEGTWFVSFWLCGEESHHSLSLLRAFCEYSGVQLKGYPANYFFLSGKGRPEDTLEALQHFARDWTNAEDNS